MRHTSPPVGLGTVICGGPVPVPVTTRETVPPLEVKLTFPVTLTGAVGVKRTTTVWLVPAPRLKDPPGGEKMPNEVEAEAFPVRVPPPMFWTVKLRSAELPRVTLPKSCEAGVTLIAGGAVPVPVTPRETLPPLEVKLTFPVTLTGAVGAKRTTTAWVAPAPRLKDPPGGAQKRTEGGGEG